MTTNLDIFLLIGQSNMSGRGRMEEVEALRHPGVRMFRDHQWLPAVEPLHNDKPDLVGIGLGMSFAVEVAAREIDPVGLVPCAVGGTRLEKWRPDAELYANAVNAAREALKGGTLRGILWHQGEADAHSSEDASSYGVRFSEMIRALRKDLGAETVPVLAGELGSFLREHKGTDHYETVNRRLRDLEGVLKHFGVVSAEGLGHNGDTLHFNAASLREFGSRYAARYFELTG